MTSARLNPANEIKDVAELDRLLELVRKYLAGYSVVDEFECPIMFA
jgi:hypothetical protein